jgi:hypothetical protein
MIYRPLFPLICILLIGLVVAAMDMAARFVAVILGRSL